MWASTTYNTAHSSFQFSTRGRFVELLHISIRCCAHLPSHAAAVLNFDADVGVGLDVDHDTMTPGWSAADCYPRHGQDLVPQAHVLQVPVESDAAHPLLPQGAHVFP